jgi:N-dimethylarginine dimethylaminohydrolase
MKYGAQTEYGKLRKVLMHRPDEGMRVVTAGNKNDYLYRDPVYWKAFQEEHDTYTDALKAEGIDVILLNELLDEEHRKIASVLPNLVYTRDVGMITDMGANIFRMTYPARFVEPTLMEIAFKKLGIPIAHKITPPGLVEGGDFVWFDKDTSMMGFGTRSNEHGAFQMRDVMMGKCIKELVLQPLPSWRVHLDGALMMMSSDLALFYSDALRLFPAYIYNKDGVEIKWLEDYLKEKGVELIYCNDTEIRVFGSNIVGLGDQKCVSYEWNERIISLLEDRGLDVISIPGSQLAIGGGGPHCLTSPILRD